MSNKERAAALLREAVGRAVKEWENDNKSHVSQGGTWKQDTWGSVDLPVAATWQRMNLPGRDLELLIAPQGEYLTCGTTGCVAGHLAVADGWRYCLTSSYFDDAEEGAGDEVLEVGYVTKGGTWDSIVSVGFSVLDPLGNPRQIPCSDDGWDSHDLFSGSNTITEVVRMADRMLTYNDLPPTGLSTLNMPKTSNRECSCLKEKED